MTTITRTKRELIHRLIERNRLNFGFAASILFQMIVVTLWYQFGCFNLLYPLDLIVEDICSGLTLSIEDDRVSVASDGDLEIVDKLKENLIVFDAPDPRIIGATDPIDLSPNIKPKLTSEAKENEVEGTLTLEIIIADTGNVLQVRSVGRKLGFGLEERAIKVYKAKKFYPAFLNGKPVKVKTIVQVRFKLESS